MSVKEWRYIPPSHENLENLFPFELQFWATPNLRVSLSWVYCRCIWKDLAAAKWSNSKVNPNQVWPGPGSTAANFQLMISEEQKVGSIWNFLCLFINKHWKFQIDPTFCSSKISNWTFAAVEPGSHLIGIDFNWIMSKNQFDWRCQFSKLCLGAAYQKPIIPLCRRQIFPNTAAINSAQRHL